MTIQEQLDDATAQYHLLVTGQQAEVYVDQSGERIEYTSANANRLLAYIQRLGNQVNASRPGPMQALM